MKPFLSGARECAFSVSSFRLFLVVILPSLVASLAFATDKMFDSGVEFGGTGPGPNPTAWGASENWDLDGVPTSEDTATFSNHFFATIPNIHLGGVNRVADSLYLRFGSTQGEWRLGAEGAFEARGPQGATSGATLTLTSGLIDRASDTNSSVHIIGATSGAGLTGAVMTLLTPASGFTITNGDEEGEVRIEAIIAGDGKSLTKSAGGRLTIARASTFTGATMINFSFQDGNTLNAAVNGALGSTASIAVEHSATLLLSNAGAADRIRNEAPLTLGPPVYTGIPSVPASIRRDGGGNEGLGNTIGLGALTQTALHANIDYGGDAAANGTLTFADFFAAGDGTLLRIRGYDGVFGTAAPGTDGTHDRLIFATDQAANLLRLEFVHPFGVNGIFKAAQISLGGGFFEIVPIGDPVSTFQVSESRRQGDDFVIAFLALAGQRYRVEASENLTDGFPIVVDSIPPAPADTIREVTDTDGLLEGTRFYRVLEIGPTD